MVSAADSAFVDFLSWTSFIQSDSLFLHTMLWLVGKKDKKDGKKDGKFSFNSDWTIKSWICPNHSVLLLKISAKNDKKGPKKSKKPVYYDDNYIHEKISKPSSRPPSSSPGDKNNEGRVNKMVDARGKQNFNNFDWSGFVENDSQCSFFTTIDKDDKDKDDKDVSLFLRRVKTQKIQLVQHLTLIAFFIGQRG